MSHKDLGRRSPPTKPTLKRPLPTASDSSAEDMEFDHTPFISESPTTGSDDQDHDKNQTGSRKARVIETSLDDLEVDYELEETIRPVSTFLETNVDVDEPILPPIRTAKSQYIPHMSSSPSQSSSSRAASKRAAPSEDFKALSSRSKSMPLETEM